MEKNIKDLEEMFICSCGSLEHQIFFWYWPEEKNIYLEVHLITHDNFFKRLWAGLKYVFGYKSRFGEWDEFILDYIGQEKLLIFLETLKK